MDEPAPHVTPSTPAPPSRRTPAAARGQEPFPLLIAVAASPTQRVRLAELVDGTAPLLMVSSLDELRTLLAGGAQGPPPEPVVPAAAPVTPVDVLTVDSHRSVARWGAGQVALTELEHDLLTRLMTEPIRVWTYQALHQAVWGDRAARGTADLHSLVKRLRRKLDELGTTVSIDTVRGTGFRLVDYQLPAGTARPTG